MNKTLQILIVEDEAITAENLKETLKKLGYGIAGVVNNATDAIDILINKKVDFAILDIQIQGNKNGIWLANYIRKTYNIPYIFLTAFGDEKTILDATLTRPYGYLLKPFVRQSLLASIKVALINFAEKLHKEDVDKEDIDKDGSTVLASINSIYIKQEDAYIKLMLNDICFLESDKNYVHLHTEEGFFLIRSTLSKIKETLPSYFLQTHRSFLVNSKKVDKIKPAHVLVNKFTIPLSNSYKTILFKKLDISS